MPPEARWTHLKAQARQATIGQLVDDAMAGVERYPPDKQEKATRTVLEQAALLSGEWAVA